MYYSHYDRKEERVTYETNKASFGDPIYIFDHESDVIEKFQDMATFKVRKEELKKKGIDLKFSTIYYILVGDKVYELQLRLTQSHGYDAKDGFLVKKPAEGSIGKFLNEAKENHPLKKILLTRESYMIGAFTVQRPKVTIV
jgi:hypothetical protein